jgi:hypothetical protein
VLQLERLEPDDPAGQRDGFETVGDGIHRRRS